MTIGTEIPLARPEIGEREQQLVAEVLASGRLSLGPMLERFEREFASFVGCEQAIATSSGTAALHLAVRAEEWGAGDEVLTSPFSFIASANCLLYEGVDTVFCDVDPRTLNIDPQAAEAAVTERTAGILAVDIFGYPADLPALTALTRRQGFGLVEDACEALGAVDAEGVAVGSRSHMTAFGFYANKQLTTGEGGMLTGGDQRQRIQAASERNQGRATDMSWVEHDRLGFNYRLGDVAAAIGVAQLERLADTLARREAVAQAYRQALEGIEGLDLLCPNEGDERRSWFVFVVQLPDGTDRDGVMDGLRERGVASKSYFPCIHTQPLYRERFGFRGGEFPVAERAAARCLALPFFPGMEEAQVHEVASALRGVLDLAGS
ncbi:MAG: DegT/DnrJ/EryC1/StrS family aminotransferase [Solirubrobacterales bacterium]